MIRSALVMFAVVGCLAVGHHYIRAQSSQATLSGRPYVVDGDSLKLGDVSVRLFGIDAPELEQDCKDSDGKDYKCGLLATSALEELIADRPVTCYAIDTDKYGRTIATCQVNSVDLGDYMVRSGNAIAYRRYSEKYVEAETDARRYHRGLWSGSFEEPEKYRHPQ